MRFKQRTVKDIVDFGVCRKSQAIGDCTNCFSDAKGTILTFRKLAKCRAGERKLAERL